MTRLSRRQCLRATSSLAATALLGPAFSRPVAAASPAWGTPPQDLREALTAPGRRSDQLLELFFYGGLCPWDTFYCQPQWGRGRGRYLHAFDWQHRSSVCGVPFAGLHPFTVDERGQELFLGPWTHPLWQRPDLVARMRVVVVRHDQSPHETAIPLALTGRLLGDPRMAGTGAAVQRHFSEMGGPRPSPFAVAIRAGDESRTQNLTSVRASGLHPTSARPLEFRLDGLGGVREQLERVRDAATTSEALVDLELARHRRAFAGHQLDGLEQIAAAHLDRHERRALAEALPRGIGIPASARSCDRSGLDLPSHCARLASRLLTLPEGQAARHVTWIDRALIPADGGGHDSHRNHLNSASVNYPHTLAALANRINKPGEANPNKIDLDTTTIALTTEFGRSPHRQAGLDGLNHWPQAYVCVLIGGVVRSPGVYGHIDEASGRATLAVTPGEFRAALLASLGIHPFAVGAFATGEVQGSTGQPTLALARLQRDILGLEVA